MHRITLAAALLCALASPSHAEPMDPRCNGSARYQAMSDADFSGHGTGHACAPQSEASGNFLAGIRSIDVVMHRDVRRRRPARVRVE